MRGIRGRLVALILLLVGGAIVSLAVFSSQLNIRVIRRMQRTDEIAKLTPLRAALLDGYADSGWAGVRRRVADVARISGQELVLTDSTGQLVTAAPFELKPGDVVLDSARRIVSWQFDRPLTDSGGRRVIARRRGTTNGRGIEGISIADPAGRRLGTLYGLVIPGLPDETVTADVAYRPLAIATGCIAIAALVLTLLLSRRVIGPVEELTTAAARMATGHLDGRVVVRGRDEIATLATTFNEMADALVQAQQLRRVMMNDIAHELRTPLTNIRCTVESLEDGVVTASPGVIDSLREEVALLQRLIDDVQDLALADVGELRLQRETLIPADELRVAVRSVEGAAAAAGVFVVVDAPDDVPPVYADRGRLQQMLRNLLRNALTHTPRGGRISASVSVSLPGMVTFAIADSGTGIAPEHLVGIFNRFFRVDPSRSRETGGAGLGLAIVKGLAEAHGGRVDVESSVGVGSRFTVKLPAEPASPS